MRVADLGWPLSPDPCRSRVRLSALAQAGNELAREDGAWALGGEAGREVAGRELGARGDVGALRT